MDEKMNLDGKNGKRSSSFVNEECEEKKKKSMRSLINEMLLNEIFIKEIGDIYRYVTTK